MTECVRKDGSGVILLGVQGFYGTDTAMDEVRSFGQAMVQGNLGNVRYEILAGAGLGNEAVAFVEASDAKRGAVSDGATLAMHRGQRMLSLASPALPPRDRAAALKTLETLETLGRIAAKRLE